MSEEASQRSIQLVLDGLPDRTYFRIGEVARVTGVKPHVLRYWEGEFPVKPKKSRSGQRLYRSQDIEMVLRVKDLLWRRKYTVAGAKRLLHRPDLNEPEPDPADLPQVDRVRETLLLVRSRLRELDAMVSESHLKGDPPSPG